MTRIAAAALFSILAAYTLTTQDGGELAPRILSAVFLLGTALYFAASHSRPLGLKLPVACLLLMTVYGAASTLWSPRKIVYNGWTAVVFWLTAAAITQIAAELFISRRAASRFRFAFVIFGSAVCLLDLLQQSSHTAKYFWLIPSKYDSVFGSFAYWNNFAEFVELLLPVTLWMALGQRKPRFPFLLLAAFQIAAVVSCGSRAGTVLVLAETVAVAGVAYGHVRTKRLVIAAGALCVLAVVFGVSAGFEDVATKFKRPDQLAVRRDLNRSSLDLIRQRPWIGWGLGTYADVYPSVARYDDGSWVNRAHNDWLQWAVEGGVPFASLMLVLFIWSLMPAVRSGWGVGVIAVGLHAAVDYPFARLGVCGWYFALIGMLVAAVRRSGTNLSPVKKVGDRFSAIGAGSNRSNRSNRAIGVNRAIGAIEQSGAI